MRRSEILIATTALTIFCVACGGGGEGDNAPVAAVTPSTIQTIAKLGALTVLAADSDIKSVMVYADAFLIAFSYRSGGSTPAATVSCAQDGAGGGSIAASTTKSASRQGFAVGDQIILSFTGCDTGDGMVMNGQMTLTAQTAMVNVSGGVYDLRYGVSLTDFSTRLKSLTTLFNGRADIQSTETVSAFSVPAGQSLKTVLSGGVSPLSMIYASGSTLRSTDVVSPSSATRQFEGKVSYSNGTSFDLEIKTPVALAGSHVSGRFLPNTGSLITRDTSRNILTSTAVSGNSVSVSGDTDRNGTLDLSFVTTWSSLTF